MSRHLLDIGDRNRKMNAGIGLVTARANPLNRRRREYFLTEKGRLLADKVRLAQRRISDHFKNAPNHLNCGLNAATACDDRAAAEGSIRVLAFSP
jgi:DNA-binding MarR family transcriptional regulator